jgi:hypothetical protein
MVPAAICQQNNSSENEHVTLLASVTVGGDGGCKFELAIEANELHLQDYT